MTRSGQNQDLHRLLKLLVRGVSPYTQGADYSVHWREGLGSLRSARPMAHEHRKLGASSGIAVYYLQHDSSTLPP